MKFDSYHPAINLIFFISVMAAAFIFNQPVFLVISFLCPFIYSVKLGGKKAFMFNLLLIPLIGIFTYYYSTYNHFGITNLGVNIIGNHITLESVVLGLVIGFISASVLMWFSCVHIVFSTDKIIYLLGRIIPKLSLFLAMLFRFVPRVKAQVKKVCTAQMGVGIGISQGTPLKRIQNLLRIVSIVVTWTLENLSETAQSMKSRGYTLKKRTAFSIYRFDGRDRSFVLTIFFCLTIILMGMLLDQTQITYNPEIILNRITPLSFIFYSTYALFCLLPMMIQILGEFKMNCLRLMLKDT